jgi:hypothetical protein
MKIEGDSFIRPNIIWQNNRRVERNILGYTSAMILWMIVIGYITLITT